MYNANLSRTEEKEGRTFNYYEVVRDCDGRFAGCMVQILIPTEKGVIEHWYVDYEMSQSKIQPCADIQECFKRALKSWKRRGGSLAK
jgi:hypothetical protein